jgi:cell division protein FtsX
MAEENNNINQDKKIDKLQFQMESVLVAVEKMDARLEAMQRGYVTREELQEFKKFVGTLATQKDLDDTKEDVSDLKSWNTWLIRTVGGVIIAGIIGASYLIK